jgi:hypothetical protein
MNRTRMIAIALCILLLTAAGVGVASAKQGENPRQAGASSVHFYEVAATGTHGSGKLMINPDQKKFTFNGVDFEPGARYVLHYETAGGADLRVFATGKVTPSGNLHVEGTWEGAFADPDAAGFGVDASSVMTGTIQRVAGEYCYALTYSDAYGDYTVYFPFDGITYAEGSPALPAVIAEPVAVDYVKTYSSTVLFFGYQGVYYTAEWRSSCPYSPPVMTVSGTYAPYRVWNDDIKVYDWYWNLHYDSTWDASHLPPEVVLQRIDWFMDGSLGNWGTYQAAHVYQQRYPGWPGYFPPQELPLVSGHSMNDGYSWLGCYAPDLDMCPANEWVQGPPFTAGITLTTIDGNTYTTTAAMTPA